MTHIRQRIILIIFSLSVFVTTFIAVFSYEYFQRAKIASLIVDAQKNNLISHNLSSAAASFSTMSPFFSKIVLVEADSHFRLLEHNNGNLNIPFKTRIATGAAPLTNSSYVEFSFNGLPIILMALCISIILTMALLALFFYFQRAREKEAQMKLTSEMHSRFYDLAIGVAHDIRSPISVLKALSSKSVFEQEDKAFLDLVAKRIGKIADDLLTKAKETNATQSGFLIVHAVNQLTREKSILLTNSSSLYLRIKCDDTIYTSGETSAFQRLLSNLIDNSIQARDESKAELKIHINVTKQDRYILVSITDNGKGIEESKLASVGIKGYTTKSEADGNGIGIWSSITLINSWGGDLKVSSKFGEGTEIKVRLPIIQAR